MGRIVIVAYRPKPGKEQALYELAQTHYLILKEISLVTDRAPIIMLAKDGSVVEVFEWISDEAIQQAHTHPEVLKMWAAYGEVCDYVPLNQLAESADMFAGFAPFN